LVLAVTVLVRPLSERTSPRIGWRRFGQQARTTTEPTPKDILWDNLGRKLNLGKHMGVLGSRVLYDTSEDIENFIARRCLRLEQIILRLRGQA
jgi:hypothetical protein